MSTTAEDAQQVLRTAECLFDQASVDEAIRRMASRVDTLLEGRETVTLCVMTGAVVVAGKLLPLIAAPLLLDYVHATRYRGNTSGGDLTWERVYKASLADRCVLVVDDILDEGYTLDAIVRHCVEAGARHIVTAVLVEKCHDRGCGFRADVVGLTVPDRYVFGYGMDYKGWLRNAPGIFAVAAGDAA
jgi:hypoxanthine phosphoribosyltransferase